MPVGKIRRFVDENREDIEAAHEAIQAAREQMAEEGDDAAPFLWITDKNKRLLIYQTMVEALYVAGRITFDATVLRELRSYMYYAAQELGQLQHRGSATGDGQTVTYTIEGVDMEQLR